MADGRAKQSLIGRDLSFNFVPITLGADGTVTTVTPFVVQGRVAEGTRRLLNTNERVMAMDGTVGNYVPDFVDWELVLTGIKYKNRLAGDASQTVSILGGADGATAQSIPVVDPFEAFSMKYTYARIIIATVVLIQEYTGLIVELDWTMRRLNQVDVLRLVPIDTGLPNPRITASTLT